MSDQESELMASLTNLKWRMAETDVVHGYELVELLDLLNNYLLEKSLEDA